MAYDSYRRRVVMWGGGPDWNAYFKDPDPVWEYDGKAWCTVPVPVPVKTENRPPSRVHASFVYDSIRRRMVLVGGRGMATDYGTTWVYETLGIPCPDDDHCSTGRCVDGACCPDTCTTPGYGCNDPASPGECGPNP
jgi:hypothetical protein